MPLPFEPAVRLPVIVPKFTMGPRWMTQLDYGAPSALRFSSINFDKELLHEYFFQLHQIQNYLEQGEISGTEIPLKAQGNMGD